ncbi:MAG: regulatory signaling modulator protein AmpE [Marinobacter sp.]|uniref:regulatory signaling modulator protein AmpE n=1 Tax=unclassified Marinobacter TaxID=83889 RepID=UPI00273CAA42|nr:MULTISPECIES: regulatory signaling modulator protein AmpE [unclassified Marinobacter]MDP4548795.1 regulatory signaling modulator protein AmpE [Marinobacter sp. MDS2]
MVLVIFLLAYVIRRKLDRQGAFSTDGFWRTWFQQGATSKVGHETSVIKGYALVVLPAICLVVLTVLAEQLGFRLAVYPLEMVLLVLLMGVPGWQESLKAYSEAWSRGDMQGAWHHVKDRLPADERGAALSPEAMHLSVSKALIENVFGRFFLVVFWYVVGGVAAAVLARGVLALAEHWPQAGARPSYRKTADWIGWIPARLLGCTFGVAGDLSGWSRKARQIIPGLKKSTTEVLMISANGSLTGYALDPERFSELHPEDWPRFGGRSLIAIRDLLNRSMLVWICVIALLVIAGMV